MNVELELLKQHTVKQIDCGTRVAILAIANIEDQLNLQAEYATLDTVNDASRIAEIETTWTTIKSLREAGTLKKEAVNAATSAEEIAAVI